MKHQEDYQSSSVLHRFIMDINTEIIDVLIDRPIGFKVGDERLCLYPLTLGKSLLISRFLSKLDIKQENIKIQPELEMIRVVAQNKDDVLTILAYHTLQTKEQVFNTALVEERKALLSTLDNGDLTTLFLQTLTADKFNIYIHELGIDREREFMNKAIKVKTSSSLSFNGKSMYGTLIDKACEKYGWTFDYVVWGISYMNLRLLLADAIQTVYLSEDERKKLHIPDDREVINASDPKNAERVKEILGKFN